jgi:hypothetical protein
MNRGLMPLDYGMLLTAVHLSNGRKALGTGFFVTVESEVPEGDPHGYLVTAYHVIHKVPKVYAQVPNAFGNGEIYPPRLVDNWKRPLGGVDIAVASFEGPEDHNYVGIPFDHIIPTADGLIYPYLGAHIYYLGLFAPAQRMMARSGTIGALEQTGLSESMGDAKKGLKYGDYPVHLVDCRSYGGFSGSPCFVESGRPGLLVEPPPTNAPKGIQYPPMGVMHYFATLCGMFVAHYDDVGNKVTNPADVVSKYGVGIMLRGQEIKEALMVKDFQTERRIKDAKARVEVERNTVKPKLASANDGDELTVGAFDDALHRSTRITAPDESAPEGSGT